MIRRPPRSTLFPYTSSSDLITIIVLRAGQWIRLRSWLRFCAKVWKTSPHSRDRKSTRLNSSHSSISYAVFCLKKKNTVYVASEVKGGGGGWGVRQRGSKVRW